MSNDGASPPAPLCFPQLLLQTIFSWPAPWPRGVQDNVSRTLGLTILYDPKISKIWGSITNITNDKMFGIIKINYKFTKSSPQVNPQFHVMSFLICVSGCCPPSFRREREREKETKTQASLTIARIVSHHTQVKVTKNISSRLFFCQDSLSLFDFIFEAKLLPFGDS